MVSLILGILAIACGIAGIRYCIIAIAAGLTAVAAFFKRS